MKYVFSITVMLLSLQSVVLSQIPEKPQVVTKDSIKKDVEKVECKNKDRLESVKKLFLEKGAKDDVIEIKDYKKVKNLVVTKKGKSDETVVIGAHYDKANSGCGAIDNWTGIAIIANLYQSLKDVETSKTYKFVAFGKEEKGLIGSSAMVKKIPKADRINYCAMVNFDSFGFAYPQALKNASSKSLVELAKLTAKDFKLSFAVAIIPGAKSDSMPFKAKKIPAITLHGLNNKLFRFLHTKKDNLSSVNYDSVYWGYKFGVNMLFKIDAKGCQEFRKKK